MKGSIPATAVALSTLTVGSAIAQIRPDSPAAGPSIAQTLPEVLVRARRSDAPAALTVPSVEAATRAADAVPGGATVVDMAPRQNEKVTNLTDALGETAGVFVQSRWGQDESRLSIRGSGLQRTFHLRGIKLLQDGVPLNQADGSGDFQAADPLAARYIEVWRGANALRYGSTTLGGAINLVSRTGYDFERANRALGGEVRGETGSFGYRRAHVQFGGVSGRFDHAASLSAYREDGYRVHSRTDSQKFLANLGYQIDDRLETRWFLSFVDSESELPGSLAKTQLRADPRQANPNNLALNQQRDFRLARLANRTVYRWQDAQLELGAFVARKELYHPIFQLLDVNSDDYGLVARYTAFGKLAGLNQRWIVGVEPHLTRQIDKRYVNLAGQRGAPTADSLQTAFNLDVYVESETDLAHQTTLVIGAQATRASRRYEDRLRQGGVDRGFERNFTRVSPKIGFIHRLTANAMVFGNLSGAYEPPSFGELTGGPGVTPLDAQRATSFELGTRGRVARAAWEMVLYRSAVRGELLSLNDAAGQPLGTVNTGRTLHQGVELAGSVAPAHWVDLRAAYLLQDFRFDGDPVFGSNRLPGLPSQFLRSHVAFKAPGGIVFGPTVEWSPRRYPVDMANTLFVDPYAIWGVRIAGPIGNAVSWWIDARNLSNRRYAASSGVIADARGQDSAQFLPGTGRSVYAGARLNF